MIDIRLSDNLELMAEMQDNTVDLIYCDILYGTGRKFKDYQDLKPKREIIEEHYIPRIKGNAPYFKRYRKYLFTNGHQDKPLDTLHYG